MGGKADIQMLVVNDCFWPLAERLLLGINREKQTYSRWAAELQVPNGCARYELAGELRTGVLRRASFIEIEDEDHRLVSTVSFGEAVTEPPETTKPQR